MSRPVRRQRKALCLVAAAAYAIGVVSQKPLPGEKVNLGSAVEFRVK